MYIYEYVYRYVNMYMYPFSGQRAKFRLYGGPFTGLERSHVPLFYAGHKCCWITRLQA